MRPLPVEPLPDMPDFVSGVAVVRGSPVPVLDGSRLLGDGHGRPGRWITLTLGGRRVVLAVDEVLGIETLASDSLQDLPPLLQEAANDVVRQLGVHDAELLLLLGEAHLVPDALWARLAEGGTAA